MFPIHTEYHYYLVNHHGQKTKQCPYCWKDSFECVCEWEAYDREGKESRGSVGAYEFEPLPRRRVPPAEPVALVPEWSGIEPPGCLPGGQVSYFTHLQAQQGRHSPYCPAAHHEEECGGADEDARVWGVYAYPSTWSLPIWSADEISRTN